MLYFPMFIRYTIAKGWYSARTEFYFVLPPVLPKISSASFFKWFHARTFRDFSSSLWLSLIFLMLRSFCSFPDARVNDWVMMSSPFPTVAICLSYAYFSKILGPKLMENRKPFDLRGVLIMYNFLQTLFSTWILYEVRFFIYIYF